MGMESYSMTILAKGVSIEYEDSCQKLIGCSVVDVWNVEEKLRNIGMQYIQGAKWLLDNYLEVYIYQQNRKFQGIEIKGCISCMEGGVKDSFQIVKKCKEWYGEFEIYILGQKVRCDGEEQLKQCLQEAYETKICQFNKQYNNMKLKVSCGDFYKEMKKRTKWHYKLFHRFKRSVSE